MIIINTFTADIIEYSLCHRDQFKYYVSVTGVNPLILHNNPVSCILGSIIIPTL